MQLLLDNLSLLDEDVHHDIDLPANVVRLFLEHLQQIVAGNQLILESVTQATTYLEGLYLFVDRC